MPRVPVLEPTASVKPVEAPAPQAYRPPEESFGGSIAAAKGQLAEQVSKTTGLATDRLIELQRRDDEQQALDVSTKFQTELQNTLQDSTGDENGVPKGFLQRQLGQTKGSVPQYDAIAQELKTKYMGQIVAPELKGQMVKLLDTHLSAGREQVIHHEATQRAADFDQSLKTNMKVAVASVANMDVPLDIMKTLAISQETLHRGLAHQGVDEDTIYFKRRELAGEIVKSAVMGHIEQSATKAEQIFNIFSRLMNPDDAAALKKTIDGKKLYDIVNNVSAVANDFRMSDGMIDRAKLGTYVKGLKLPAEQEYQVMSHVDHLAAVDWTELQQRRQNAEREFTNEVVVAHSQGVPYDQALKIPAKHGWDTTSVANMQAEVTKLYASPEDKFTTWLSRQPEPTQGAWAETVNLVKAKYGSSLGTVAGVRQKLADAALTELKQAALGKSADQIRQITADKMQKVTIGPGAIWGSIWPDKAPGWKADAELRHGLSQANSLLERDYGPDRVGRAKAFLATSRDKQGRPIPITPANLKRVLDESVRHRGPQ